MTLMQMDEKTVLKTKTKLDKSKWVFSNFRDQNKNNPKLKG